MNSNAFPSALLQRKLNKFSKQLARELILLQMLTTKCETSRIQDFKTIGKCYANFVNNKVYCEILNS